MTSAIIALAFLQSVFAATCSEGAPVISIDAMQIGYPCPPFFVFFSACSDEFTNCFYFQCNAQATPADGYIKCRNEIDNGVGKLGNLCVSQCNDTVSMSAVTMLSIFLFLFVCFVFYFVWWWQSKCYKMSLLFRSCNESLTATPCSQPMAHRHQVVRRRQMHGILMANACKIR